MRLQIIPFFWLFFSLIIGLNSLSQNLTLKHYSISQGLPSSECYTAIKDSKGYLWIGTDAGIVKYDGYGFKTYNNSKGLTDNTVFKIHEDKTGKIWMATFSGKMYYYLHETDSIYAIKANRILSDKIAFYPFDFAFDKADTLYVSNARRGYLKIYPPEYNVASDNYKKSNGLFIKELDNGQFIFGSDFEDRLGYPRWMKIVSYKGNQKLNNNPDQVKVASRFAQIRAVKENSGDYIFSDGTSVLRISKTSQKIVIDSLSHHEKIGIISLSKDRRQNIWVGSYLMGVYLYEKGNFTQKPKIYFPNLSVSAVLEDEDGGIWITTLEDGVYHIPSLKFFCYNKAIGITADKIWSVYKYQQHLFALSADKILNDIDVLTEQPSVKKTTLTSAWSLYGEDSLLLMCGTTSSLYNIRQGKNTELWKYRGDKIYPQYLRYASSYDKDYFLGCGYDDIFLINKRTAETTNIIKHLPNLSSVLFDGEKILIGTKEGLRYLRNNRLEVPGDKYPILNNKIVDMIKVNETVFLASRGAGVICLRNDQITYRFNEKNGLPSNICKSICKDKFDNVWVGTNRGMVKINVRNKNNFHINSTDLSKGFVSNEINQIFIDDSLLYFATNDGVGSFNIFDVKDKHDDIPIYIEEFSVNETKHSAFKYNLFKYNQNNIRISYRGIYLRGEGDLLYRYKFEGLDLNWHYTKETQIQFSNLAPGDYKFALEVQKTDGTFSRKSTRILFTITPPFWKSWWFILLSILCFLLFIALFYKRRIDIIKIEENKKTEINKLIAESELKALRAQMNPHFIFNAINSIQSFILKNNTHEAHKYLTKFARLIRSVLENSKHDFILLSQEIESLKLYIELEALRASFSFDFSINVNTNTNEDSLLIPTMLIQPYVENAILHGLMPLKERHGQLIIKFEQENQKLKCTIEDNGIGRVAAEEIKLKKHSAHKSMGMSVTQERLDIINNQNEITSDVKIIDKLVNGIPAGTIVEIYLELKKNNL